MSRFEYIENAVWNAQLNISSALNALEADIIMQRELTRNFNTDYHRERKVLKQLNNKKRRLLREKVKIDTIKKGL